MQPDAILAFFARYIHAELGLVYAEHNYFQLQNRLEELAGRLGLAGTEALYSQAREGISGDFRQLLLDLATNNETSFFRDPQVFASIEAAVLRPAAREGRPLKIWSAASSSGQEALSLAILVQELRLKEGAAPEVRILGTDVSERMLRQAKAALYSELEVQRGLSSRLLSAYFRPTGKSEWAALPELTRTIEYRRLNLKEPFSFPEPFDLVLCRNILIYQDAADRKAILARISACLAPGGFLVLGAGESLIGISDDFEATAIAGAIIYQKARAAASAAA